jgi:hypothetical protein
MKRKLSLAALAFAVFAGTIGLATAQDGRSYDRDDDRYYHRDYDRDDYRYDRDHDRHEFREGIQTAHQLGYQDGMQVGREDSWRGKRFNPSPRGHNHADSGYQREFGSRHEYREQYARAYHEGYEHGYQSNGYSR